MRIEVQADKAAPIAIEQRVHFADDHSHKHRILDHLLADVAMTQSIVFIATKRDAESLAQRLKGEGHAAAALHGDMNQHERTRTLTDMRRGRVRTLVATDVAARGIDVAGISHVINFDLPRQAGDYVHRIGRTGRAGAAGIAVSIANHAERGAVRLIERFTGAAIPALEIPGLEPRRRESRVAPRTGFAKPAFRGAHAPAHARPAPRWDDRAGSGSGRRRERDEGAVPFRVPRRLRQEGRPRALTARSIPAAAPGWQRRAAFDCLSSPAPARYCAADRWRRRTGFRPAPSRQATARPRRCRSRGSRAGRR